MMLVILARSPPQKPLDTLSNAALSLERACPHSSGKLNGLPM
jgi:hypothetical protein